MFYIKPLTSLLIIVFLSFSTFGQSEIHAPDVLYHWLSFKSLKRLSLQEIKPFPLKKFNNSFFISVAYPELIGRNALFAWEYPVTGIGVSSHEIYGKGEALLALMIAPNARVKKLTTELDYILETQGKLNYKKQIVRKKLPFNLNHYDLLYHVVLDLDGSSYLKEWVVLNPHIVKGFTADPTILSSTIRHEYSRIMKQDNILDPKYHHVKCNNLFTKYRKEILLPILDRYLKGSINRIPKMYRGYQYLR